MIPWSFSRSSDKTGLLVYFIFSSILFYFTHPVLAKLSRNVVRTNQLAHILNELILLQNQIAPLYPELDVQDDDNGEFENEWVVQFKPELSYDEIMQIANITDSAFLGKVRGFHGFYVFRKDSLPTHVIRKKREIEQITNSLTQLEQVIFAEHQRAKRRSKREVKEYENLFTDPLWNKQWILHNYKNSTAKFNDMQIIEAWDEGYTGKGVVLSILDDGIDYKHEDLAPNYDPKASYDLNNNDEDPMPTQDAFNKHGTRCAGEIAMVANNSICGVGIAYNSKIGGVRMLDGKITDRIEAEALSFALDHIDIYSASWGPNDDGKTVEGPGTLAQMALLKGIQTGRNGKGAIYVWASGNGGLHDDDCNCDGYADSIYTFSVSSTTENGTFPWYGEACASTITATFSTGRDKSKMIMTTDIANQCATDHSGTSASAPIAAAIIALGLEANPDLTWRDVQHIGVWTADPSYLMEKENDWQMNGAGLLVSPKFGFGLMNALNFVKAAKEWKNVPEHHICTTEFPQFKKRSVSNKFNTIISFETDACNGMKNEVNYIEHVQLVADIEHSYRGHLQIWLVSPQGTRTQILSKRKLDKAKNGFKRWPFTSVHTWGENPKGRWELHIEDLSEEKGSSNGFVKNISLIIYGTKDKPAHYASKKIYKNVDLKKLSNPVKDDESFDKAKSDVIEQGKSILENTAIRRSVDINVYNEMLYKISQLYHEDIRRSRRQLFVNLYPYVTR